MIRCRLWRLVVLVLLRRVVLRARGEHVVEELSLRQHAVAGAIARCVAQTAIHPLNVAKTVLQTAQGEAALKKALQSPKVARATLSRGVGAQALLSLPNGAINFWAMEASRRVCSAIAPSSISESGRGKVCIDLFSASFGTALATLVSLPQSVLNDRIMSGVYKNLNQAAREIGFRGLYPPSTWRAALLSKVPAYALNWACYQQLRRWRLASTGEEYTTPMEDLVIGALASSISVCVMIPLDTIKVRMTTLNAGGIAYLGISDCVRRMLKEEGVYSFYRGLPPRLASVVPMSCIQFAVYEDLKRQLPKLNTLSFFHWKSYLFNINPSFLSRKNHQEQQLPSASIPHAPTSIVLPPGLLQQRQRHFSYSADSYPAYIPLPFHSYRSSGNLGLRSRRVRRTSPPAYSSDYSDILSV